MQVISRPVHTGGGGGGGRITQVCDKEIERVIRQNKPPQLTHLSNIFHTSLWTVTLPVSTSLVAIMHP